MSIIAKITRRDFLRQTGVGTGALVLGCYISPKGLFAEDIFQKAEDIFHNGARLNNFVAIEPVHGTIIIMAFRSEMGQGIRSSLAAVLADELDADWSRVVVRQADAEAERYAVPNDPGAVPKFVVPEEVSQFVDSSRSMALYYQPMRLFGAGIRYVMVHAAAKVFGVDPAECEAKQHKVSHKGSNRSLDFGDLRLLLEAKKVPVPTTEQVTKALKPSDGSEWSFIGKKTMPFVDAQDMVTGRAEYGADVHRPGMLTAMIVRCPVANGRVRSFDPTAAMAIPGVKHVEKVLPDSVAPGGVGGGFTPHAGVAVLAENTWAAWQGRRALKVEWDLDKNPHATYDSTTYRAYLEAQTAKPGNKLRSKGDVDAAFAPPNRVVEASYYVPHLAQAPMEPPAAVALYDNGRFEIWSPTQGAEVTQHFVGVALLPRANPLEDLAWQVTDEEDCVGEVQRAAQRSLNDYLGKMLKLDLAGLKKLRDERKKEIRDKVKVHVTLLGGGFGRKSKPDYGIEAAFLAKQHPGVPIRVQWTREDDIKFSYFNAVSHQYLKAAVDGEGRATALLQRSAFTSFFGTLFPPPNPDLGVEFNEIMKLTRAATQNGGEYPFGSAIELAQGLEDMPFDVANLRIENCAAENHIRVGWMRAVANIYHGFSICSFADELAVAAGRDSKEYLLSLIGKGGKLKLKAEDVASFDNNGFPVEPCGVLPGYPPDTRRLRAVVERVAKESGWDEKKGKMPKGRGLGIAAHRSFLSYVAMVIDVSLNDLNELTINEVYAVIDCGIAVNPDRVRAQMEGGIVYGLSLALLGEITVKGGAVEQSNFDDYPVLRLYQTPKIIRTYVEPPSKEVRGEFPGGDVPPTGVGEPPVPPVAPALANAIVAAGGPRIRELPFYKALQIL